MARPVLDETHIHPAVREQVAQSYASTVQAVQSATANHAVVVVGMGWNPFVRQVGRVLREAGVVFEYLEYGNYLSQWRRRNALKMWTGWPTFPMVFVKGTLVGGAQDVRRLVASGELNQLLA